MVPHLFVIYISKANPLSFAGITGFALYHSTSGERLAEELRDQTLALHHIVLGHCRRLLLLLRWSRFCAQLASLLELPPRPSSRCCHATKIEDDQLSVSRTD